MLLDITLMNIFHSILNIRLRTKYFKTPFVLQNSLVTTFNLMQENNHMNCRNTIDRMVFPTYLISPSKHVLSHVQGGS